MVALTEMSKHRTISMAILRDLQGFADGAMAFVDSVLDQGILEGGLVNENGTVPS